MLEIQPGANWVIIGSQFFFFIWKSKVIHHHSSCPWVIPISLLWIYYGFIFIFKSLCQLLAISPHFKYSELLISSFHHLPSVCSRSHYCYISETYIKILFFFLASTKFKITKATRVKKAGQRGRIIYSLAFTTKIRSFIMRVYSVEYSLSYSTVVTEISYSS